MTATLADIRLLERARNEIGELIESRTTFISSGAASDYATYRSNCGYIEGLTTALSVLGDIVRSMGESR